jgi:hypothetical protein
MGMEADRQHQQHDLNPDQEKYLSKRFLGHFQRFGPEEQIRGRIMALLGEFPEINGAQIFQLITEGCGKPSTHASSKKDSDELKAGHQSRKWRRKTFPVRNGWSPNKR